MNAENTYSPDPLGYYRILKLDRDAKDDAVKLSYREQAKKWHPDHNAAPEAMEIFQKISVAYDILSDEHKRLTYDLAALSHPAHDFPDIFSLKILTNAKGENDVSVRRLNIWQLRGKIIKYSLRQMRYVCNYAEAEKIVLKNSLQNSLLGWWSPQSLLKNIAILKKNYQETGTNFRENLNLLIHNALAYEQEHLYPQALLSARQAEEYADTETKILLERFIKSLPETTNARPLKWNYQHLRRLQLVVPGTLIALIFACVAGVGLSAYLPKSAPYQDKINYYQEVRHWRGKEGVDDVVVAKIIDIRTDSDSRNMLFHVKSGAPIKVMYGPSDDFDEITRLPEKTTVRVTGISPDKTWYRIMLDNGDMGFVHSETLTEGIGAPVPPGSKVYTGR